MIKVVHQTPAWDAFNSVVHGAGCGEGCQRRAWAREVSELTAKLKSSIQKIRSTPVKI
jgi:hypothetical protein